MARSRAQTPPTDVARLRPARDQPTPLRRLRWLCALLCGLSCVLVGCERPSAARKGHQAPQPTALANDASTAAVLAAPASVTGVETVRVGRLSGAIDQGKAAVPFLTEATLLAHGPLGASLSELAFSPPTDGTRQALLAASAVAPAALADALWHESATLRAGAAHMLNTVDINHALVRVAVLRSLRQEPDRDVRAAVSAALIGQSAQALAPALSEVLAGDASSRVRANAAWALGTSADAGTVAALVGSLGDADATVRLAAVASLRRLRVRDQLAALRRMQQDPDSRVRRAASAAVDDLGGQHADRNRGDAL